MTSKTFEEKQAHEAKTRRSNYLASLRLEGFDVKPEDAQQPLPDREQVLRAYRNNPGND